VQWRPIHNAQAHLSLAIVYGRIALNEAPRRKVRLSRIIKQEAETAARLDQATMPGMFLGVGVRNRQLQSGLEALAQTVYGKLPDASNEKANGIPSEGNRPSASASSTWSFEARHRLSAKRKRPVMN
jgi:hypothetical protein